MYRISLLLVVFLAASISVAASEDRAATYVVHMDKAQITALANSLGDSKKWYEAVMDSITELSTEEDGGEAASAPELLYNYETAITGFAARLSTRQLESLHKVEGFLSAVPDEMVSLQTTYSSQFLGLKLGRGLLNSHNSANDVIIGFIDSGIWPEHPSFEDEGVTRPVPSRWKGVCEEGTRFTAQNCNKKLVGARAYFKGYEAAAGEIDETEDFRSARDSLGHGTHTASTAAGSMVDGASLFGMADGVAVGMSSTARIAAYKVCYARGCANSDILAAIDQAVADGVDVLSLSVGGSSKPYYTDVLAIASLGAVQNGVFVAASARKRLGYTLGCYRICLVQPGAMILGGQRPIAPCLPPMPGRRSVVTILKPWTRGPDCGSFCFFHAPVRTIGSTIGLLVGYSKDQLTQLWSDS